MKERPIIMSPEMATAAHYRLKTMTRRTRGLDVLNADPDAWRYCGVSNGVHQWHSDKYERSVFIRCPYGTIGDRLYVRENWARSEHNWLYQAEYLRGGGGPQDNTDDWDWPVGKLNHWKPSIHMPREACRTRLDLTHEPRGERLQDISPDDAIAEGAIEWATSTGFSWSKSDKAYPVFAFQALWESINGPGSWAANPWVWALTFKKVEVSK